MPELTAKHFSAEGELGPEAREVIAAYQSLRQEQDEKKQLDLCAKLDEQLVRLLTPGEERHRYSGSTVWHESVLRRMRSTFIKGEDCLSVGSGTAGQRVYFRNRDIDGHKSSDGNVQWMWYPEPSQSDLSYGAAKYRERFLQIFGKDIVDLLQNIG